MLKRQSSLITPVYLSLSLLCSTSIHSFYHVSYATAQIKPEENGTGTQLSVRGTQIDISGGRLSGDRRNLFHSFEEFGLTAEQIANFQVDADVHNVLGRVVGGNASLIDGLIQVSGSSANLYLMNPAGMVFGPNAQLNLAGDFTATTATGIGMGDDWFNAVGDNRYRRLSGSPAQFSFVGLPSDESGQTFGSIVNAGELELEFGQHLMLLGGSVINTGTLEVPGGQITVAAVPNDNVVRVSQDNMVLNLEMALEGDPVLHRASQGPNPVSFSPLSLPELLTAPGLEQATNIEVSSNGRVQLTGSELSVSIMDGTAIASNTLDTSIVRNSWQSDGPIVSHIHILGERVGLIDATAITSTLDSGGSINIGGSFQGQGLLPNASQVFVNEGTQLQANALESGNGGTVIVWADEVTQFMGNVQARGGSHAGDGGFVEISGKQTLAFDGIVDTTAPLGELGTLLLDPKNIRIVALGNGEINSTETNVPFGVASEDTVIASNTIESATTDVILQANNDIIVDDDIDTTTSGPNPSLTLQAGRKIDLNASIRLIDGNFTAIINDAAADPSEREPGVAQFTLADGETLEVLGNGDINISYGTFGSTHLNVPDSGEILLTGTVQTDAGDITLIGLGGTSGFDSEGTGILLEDTVLQTNTGNISLDGEGGDTSDATASGDGVWIDEDSSINILTSGNLIINGVGGNDNSRNSGVQLDGSLSVTNGSLSLSGSGGGMAGGEAVPGSGISLANGAEIILVGSTATVDGSSGLGNSSAPVAGIEGSIFTIDMSGSDLNFNGQHDQPTEGFHHGIDLRNGNISGADGSSFVVTGAVSQGDGTGVRFTTMDIDSPAMVINGTSNSPNSSINGVVIDDSTIGVNGGDLLITGDASVGLLIADSAIATTTGTLQLTADDMAFLAGTTLEGDGILHLQPLAPTSDISLGPADGIGLTLDSTELDTLGNDFSEIQIGRTNGRGSITSQGDMFFSSPVLLQSPNGAGSIDTTASLWGIGSDTAGDIRMVAGGDITVDDISVNPLVFADGADFPVRALEGGNITLEAGRNINVLGLLNAASERSTGSDQGGNIVLDASRTIDLGVDAILNVSSFSDGGASGDAGTLTLTAGRNITSNGLMLAGSDAFGGSSGDGGSIELTAANNIDLFEDLSTESTAEGDYRAGSGGDIRLEAGGSITIEGVLDTSANSGREVSGNGGTIEAIATRDFSWTGGWDTTAEASRVGGDITLTSTTGRLDLAVVTDDNSTNRVSGAVTFNSQTGTSLEITPIGSTNPYLSSTGNPITVTSNGAVSLTSTVAAPFTLATEGADLKIEGTELNLNNVDLSTAQADGTGGRLTLESTLGAIAVGSLDSSGQQGGSITLSANADIQVGSINAEGGTNGQGGTVDITTTQLFRAIDTFESRDDRVASISTNGGNGGGNIVMRYGSGMETPFAIGDGVPPSLHGTAGEVTTGTQVLSTGESFLGRLARGNIQLITDTATIPVISDPATPGTETDPTIDPLAIPQNSENPSLIPPSPPAQTLNPTSGSPNPISPQNQPLDNRPIRQVQAARLIANLATSDPLSYQAASPRTQASVHKGQADDPIDGSSVESGMSPGGVDRLALEFDTIDDVESEISDDFADHFALPFDVTALGTIGAQHQLRTIQSTTGVTPALIYVQFVPTRRGDLTKNSDLFHSNAPQGDDQLEITLVSSGGQPIRLRPDGVTRHQVERVVRQFQNDITNPARRNGDRYLTSAQTLYRWLITPLEATLKREGIENLSFILDSGLRALPMAALHNGEEFLIEQYSLGMMPSLSLTDTRYVDTRDLGILAMGASEFETQAPLPAVPVELAIITEEVWPNGEYFLNQDFTMENLKAQRQETPYGIVHLATHGEFRSGIPENSYLQLGDRPLPLNEFRELGLHDPAVELLVLSACRTALGDEEAELGFAGLALQAGVKSVMASLWYVSDAGALGLTTEFYRQLQDTPIKAEALRQAQLAMIRGDMAIEDNVLRSLRGGTITLPNAFAQSDDMNFSHPFYWSAFTMIGSPW